MTLDEILGRYRADAESKRELGTQSEQLMAQLCDTDPDRMLDPSKMKGFTQPGIYLDDKSGDNVAPIGHGLYAWHSMNNPSKFNTLRKIVKAMGLDPGSIRIIIDPQSAEL